MIPSEAGTGPVIASTRSPTGVRQVLRTPRGSSGPGHRHRTARHPGNVPEEASFPAFGSFPSPQLWNDPIDHFGPSIGFLYRRTCPKSDRESRIPGAGTAPSVATPARRTGRPRLPAEHASTLPRGMKVAKSHTIPRPERGACVRARWATQISRTPQITGRELTFARGGTPPAATASALLWPEVGRSQRPTSRPSSAAGGVCPVAPTTPRNTAALANNISRPTLLDSRRPTALPHSQPNPTQPLRNSMRTP
jgi:hypothetical protein